MAVAVAVAVAVTSPAYYDMPQEYTGPPIPEHVSTSSTNFAADMYGQIAADPDHEDKNIFFSPFSVYVAFAFLYEGAVGQAASQMQDVFGFSTDRETRHGQMSHTMNSINRHDSHATLETASALWLDRGFVPYAAYTDIVRDIYRADVETLDFGGDAKGSAERINDWAADKTHGKIMKVVSASDLESSVAVLNNAVYFKGTWAMQFDPGDTHEDSFWRQPNDPADVDFMRTVATFNYTTSDGVEILNMPYAGDRLSMLVFLPSEQIGIDGLEGMLSAQKIDGWRQDLRLWEVEVTMPKFTTGTHYNLIDYLISLGIRDAFSLNSANFSGMADLESLYVSDTLHDAFVNVNEKGTEAAAVTTIALSVESDAPQTVFFNANRPFIFAIQDDESGTILFMGRISDPSA